MANQRGQALVEMGIVILLLVSLAIGVMEFGWAWMAVNMITHAARDGARSAALVPPDARDDSTGHIGDTSGIENLVRGEIGSVLDAGTVSGLSVTVSYPDSGNSPLIAITVAGDIPYLFGLFGDSFSVSRSVTFRDEGR